MPKLLFGRFSGENCLFFRVEEPQMHPFTARGDVGLPSFTASRHASNSARTVSWRGAINKLLFFGFRNKPLSESPVAMFGLLSSFDRLRFTSECSYNYGASKPLNANMGSPFTFGEFEYTSATGSSAKLSWPYVSGVLTPRSPAKVFLSVVEAIVIDVISAHARIRKVKNNPVHRNDGPTRKCDRVGCVWRLFLKPFKSLDLFKVVIIDGSLSAAFKGDGCHGDIFTNSHGWGQVA